MKYILLVFALFFALEAHAAGCKNGMCVRPAPKQTVRTKVVTKETVRVAKPYRFRCVNGKCYVR